jgi:hypothetical protein
MNKYHFIELARPVVGFALSLATLGLSVVKLVTATITLIYMLR